MKRVALIAAVVALCVPGWRLEARQPSAPAGPGASERPREQAHKYLEAYFISTLQERLALSDEQFARLLPAVMRLQSERREQQQRRVRASLELRRLLESGRATEDQVLDALRELKQVEKEAPGLVSKLQDAVDAQLSVVQQAKFRVLEMEVERKVRELLQANRHKGPGRRGGAHDPGRQ